MGRNTRGGSRTLLTGMPVALAGSIALSVIATPAHAHAAVPGNATHASAVRVPAVADAPSYEVRSGDTVTAIAARHGLRTVDVLSWNGLGWSSIIRPGQVLRLSAPGDGNPPAAPAAAPEPAAPPAASAGSYVVVAGDTMSRIAARHGVSTDAILAANGLSRSSIIYPGQTVAIPGASAAASPAAPPPAAAAAPAVAVALDGEQAANAQTIIRVGRSLGVSDRAIAIALATAMQESSLRNLDHGPDDSLGLFQQRPSMGWGTDAEVRDADRATRVFFGGAGDPNGTRTRGLLDIPGWETLGFAQAAQAVQISAYPDRYGAWEHSAYSWLTTLG